VATTEQDERKALRTAAREEKKHEELFANFDLRRFARWRSCFGPAVNVPRTAEYLPAINNQWSGSHDQRFR
jgi:hypothetical protein